MTGEAAAAWPEERHFAREVPDPTRTYFAQRKEEILYAIAHPQISEEAIGAIVNWLREQRDADTRLPDRSNLTESIIAALEQAGFHSEASNLLDASGDDGVYIDVAPTLAVAVAQAAIILLRGEPDCRSWEIASSLRRRGNRLGPAFDELLEQALAESHFRNRFFQLAESLVSDAAAAPERQVPADRRETFTTMIQEWQKGPTLLDLWFGLRELDYVQYYGSEGEILKEIARLDPSRFISCLGQFNNPYQIWAAINDTEAAKRFEMWRSLVYAAPTAFRSDGSWTGSVILPLLLVVARHAVAQGAAPFARYETANAAQEGGRDVSDAAEAVAATLLARADGPPAALRWATWLARDVVSTSADVPPVATDARDRAFTPWHLLFTIAQSVGPNTWTSVIPPDLPIEETWFSLMAKVVSVERLPSSARDYADLLAAFMLPWPEDNPEVWQSEHGARLRATSGVIRTFARQPMTLGVRILAIPLTMSPDPVAALIELWRRGSVLREAVEFGELRFSSSSDNDASPRAAAELCWLTTDLGMCVIDQIADQRMTVTYDRGAVLAKLLALLWDGVSEMIAIDRFLGETWGRTRRHLVLRRALFAIDGDKGPGPYVIPAGTMPTLASMLRSMAALERPFFSSLIALLDAGLTVATLRSALAEGSVDLTMLLDAAERANAIDDRRPMIKVSELQRLRQAV